MERYALNETPLAGYATMYGQGAAAQAITVTGVPYLMIFGRPVAAAMSASASADAVLALLGRGAAEMAMTAAGRCYLILCGIGDVAFMALSALADGRVIPVARGMAAMTMITVGNGIKALLGAGAAQLGIGAAGQGTMATMGAGDAEMELSGSAGIPNPIAVPGTFTDAHPSRRIVVEPDWNTLTAAAQDRTIFVGREPRTVSVAAERNA